MNESQQKHGAWVARYLKEQIHDVLVSRGQKYNGENFEDPFKQFKDAAYLTYGEINEETIDHSIRYMINHKVTRLANNHDDFDDESRKDTVADLIGYLTLYAEWLEQAGAEVPKDLPALPAESAGSWKKSWSSFLKGSV